MKTDIADLRNDLLYWNQANALYPELCEERERAFRLLEFLNKKLFSFANKQRMPDFSTLQIKCALLQEHFRHFDHLLDQFEDLHEKIESSETALTTALHRHLPDFFIENFEQLMTDLNQTLTILSWLNDLKTHISPFISSLHKGIRALKEKRSPLKKIFFFLHRSAQVIFAEKLMEADSSCPFIEEVCQCILSSPSSLSQDLLRFATSLQSFILDFRKELQKNGILGSINKGVLSIMKKLFPFKNSSFS